MTTFQLLTSRFTSTLIVLLMAVPLSTYSEGADAKSDNSSKSPNSTKNSKSPRNRTPATIGGVDSASLTEDIDPDADNLLEAGGLLTISDSNTNQERFTASTTYSNLGSLTIETSGNWRYSADNTQAGIQDMDNGTSLNDVFTVSSIDGTTHNITITLLGVDEPNSPAVISGVNSASLTEDVDPDADNLLEASGLLSISDADANEASFTASTVNSNLGSLTMETTGNWIYTADNTQTAIQNLDDGTSLSDSFTVNSFDGTTHNITITIHGTDDSGTNTLTLTWTAPSEREDSSPISLSEIAGYKIYYGTAPGHYINNVTMNDGTAESYVFTDLPANTYYLVMTTYDTDGRESKYTPEVIIIKGV